MKSTTIIAVLLGIAPASFAQPQTQGSVTLSLSWEEWHQGSNGWVNAVKGNGGTVPGRIEAGEGALFHITVSMSGTPGPGGTGSPQTWNPTLPSLFVGSSGFGTLAGFLDVNLELAGDGGAGTASGTWSDRSTNYAPAVRKRLLTWIDGLDEGTPLNGGSKLKDIVPGQYQANVAGISSANNQFCFQGLWIPGSTATARTVNWALAVVDPARVGARDNTYEEGYTWTVPLTVQTLLGGPVGVPVGVPAPSWGVVFLMAGASTRRRRR